MTSIKRRALLLAAIGLPASLSVARAGSGAPYSARLVGGEMTQGNWRAGLDIALDESWKTYWRMPGDAGIPPQFDWSRSRNVRSVKVLWPAPSRFVDKAGETVGYKNRVVFPLDILAEDAATPVELVLDVFLGVCEVICIPVKLDMSLVQSETSPGDASLIAAFAARVPRKVDVQSPFRVADASLVGADGKFDLALRLSGRSFDRDLDIFVEGGDFAYFRAPRPAGEKGLFNLRVDGLKDASKLRGRPVLLTMTAGNIRLEQDITVD